MAARGAGVGEEPRLNPCLGSPCLLTPPDADDDAGQADEGEGQEGCAPPHVLCCALPAAQASVRSLD